MIELPEAVTIAQQITEELQGRRVESGTRGNTPHKFAFYSRSAEEYEQILAGKTIGPATDHGSCLLVRLDPGYVLVLGGGGERIICHPDETTLPKKHHLFLRFTDGSYLTVTIQGWGSALLLDQAEAAGHPHVGPPRVSPIGDAFTLEYLRQLFAEVPPEDPRSIKFFCISKPGIWGLGNGYLQDILFQAKVHPRRRVTELKKAEVRALHRAIAKTLTQATKLGGRDTERDLHNRPGRYSRTLHSGMVGEPCPECGAAIEKIAYLGGASYFCPACQR